MATTRRRGNPPSSGAPEWLVTFADLMSLLCCFFVLIISFSIPDDQKMQIVSGSMREAFGTQPVQRRAGMLEVEGVPVRRYLKDVAPVPSEQDASHAEERHDTRSRQGPEANTHDFEKSETEQPRQFLSAAASLRQALQDLPDIAEVSKHVLLQEMNDGLHIEIMDQDGRAMFPEGAKHPHEVTTRLLMTLAPVLARMPHRLKVTGHTSADRNDGRVRPDKWGLSTSRALAVQEVLARHGVSTNQFSTVAGRADTEPLFPDSPQLAANRRVTILLLNEAPPLPVDHRL